MRWARLAHTKTLNRPRDLDDHVAQRLRVRWCLTLTEYPRRILQFRKAYPIMLRITETSGYYQLQHCAVLVRGFIWTMSRKQAVPERVWVIRLTIVEDLLDSSTTGRTGQV
jgi:hypothetical protein